MLNADVTLCMVKHGKAYHETYDSFMFYFIYSNTEAKTFLLLAYHTFILIRSQWCHTSFRILVPAGHNKKTHAGQTGCFLSLP